MAQQRGFVGTVNPSELRRSLEGITISFVKETEQNEDLPKSKQDAQKLFVKLGKILGKDFQKLLVQKCMKRN